MEWHVGWEIRLWKIESECRVVSISNGIKMNGMEMRIKGIFHCEYIPSSTGFVLRVPIGFKRQMDK